MKKLFLAAILFATGALLGGCNSTTVKSTDVSEMVTAVPDKIPEDQLLDVGIGIFNPGIENAEEEQHTYPEVRRAEARYMPNVLATTLQKSRNWGVVRVIPNRQSEMDVWVDGVILRSDGEFLKLRVTVHDSSGHTWFTKTYEEEASKYAYDRRLQQGAEPFQGVYNRIANDMLAHRKLMQPMDVKRLRTITELRFARSFSPDAFSDYLATDNKGRYLIMRLPSEDDPLLKRVRRIRERDYLFVDTLQDYYTSFSSQMEEPYRQWREESYKESQLLREAQASSRNRLIGGALAILGGIAAAVAGSGGSPAAQTAGSAAGMVGVGAGAMLIKSGLDKRSEAKLHAESLREIAASLDAEIAPHEVELEDRTVTLTGTVEQQYNQWRDILREIYITETGGIDQ